MDVVSFTLGPIQENGYLLRRSKDADVAVLPAVIAAYGPQPSR